jgi:hypothetical protein
MGGVRYVSFLQHSGYGEAARAYMRGLQRAGVPLTWTPLAWRRGLRPGYRPLGGRTVGDPELDPICNRALDHDTILLHLFPELMTPWIDEAAGKRLVGCTVWETDRLPGHWPAILNRLDLLLVPCRWNREVFARSGVTVPIEVIPHLADDAPPAESPPPWPIPPGDFVFYTIGDWSPR